MEVPEDFALALSANNGSVPPRYQQSVRTTLDASGAGEAVHSQGYGTASRTTVFQIDADDLRALITDLAALGLFSTAWTRHRPHHIGGPTTTLRATATGLDVHIPPYVPPEQSAARAAILDRICATLGEANSTPRSGAPGASAP